MCPRADVAVVHLDAHALRVKCGLVQLRGHLRQMGNALSAERHAEVWRLVQLPHLTGQRQHAFRALSAAHH
jgi:hypothetical protein